MKIEAVVVCVDYADFLAWTLPVNKAHFDQLVVVTSTTDHKTQRLCEYWHVRCLVTDVCYEAGARFNKGKMINVGLKALDGDGWVVHLDADIFLPPQFRHIVQDLVLDPKGIYATDRLMCDDFLDWLKFWTEPELQNEANIYVHPRPFKMGVRIAKKEHGGWIPIGFFQMWNQGLLKLKYPTDHSDAGRSDMLFALNFTRDHRHMLPEILCIHLATPGDSMGANWLGRRTPQFGAEVLKPDDTTYIGALLEDRPTYSE